MGVAGAARRPQALGVGAVIFVTVGSMFPFDRLVRAMDNWAQATPGREVVAQIGDGAFTPEHMRWVRRLEPTAFEDAVNRADLVVAHAGIGSMLTARTAGTPIVLLPRRRQLGEHNSDHQVETVMSLRGRKGIFIADSETDLAQAMQAALTDGPPAALTGSSADPAFIARIRGFIEAAPLPERAP